MFDQFDLVDGDVVFALFIQESHRPLLVRFKMVDFREFIDDGVKFCEANTIKTPEYIKDVFGDR